jgi:hypothetical protein
MAQYRVNPIEGSPLEIKKKRKKFSAFLAKVLPGKKNSWIEVEIKTIILVKKITATIGVHQYFTKISLNLLNITLLLFFTIYLKSSSGRS